MLDANKIFSKQEISDLRPAILEEINRLNPYSSFRKNQVLVVYSIIKSFMEGKKFYILESATGFGKSLCAVLAMRVISSLFEYTNEDNSFSTPVSLVCTKTKALQTQYAKDYPSFSSLWSASGYQCNRDPLNKDAYYNSHECDKKLCFYYNECNYRLAKTEFIANREGILNNAFFMHFATHKPDLLVLDEAHNLEKGLVDHLHVKINPVHTNSVLEKLEKFSLIQGHEIRQVYQILSNIVENQDLKGDWFKTLIEDCSQIMPIIHAVLDKSEQLKKSFEKGEVSLSPDQRKSLYFNNKMLDSFCSKLDRLIGSTVEWVISERSIDESIDLKPISLAEEAGFLFSRAKFVILMSATICGIPLFCQTLGIKEEDYSSISIDSDVPVQNRQVINVGLPGMKMSNRVELLPMYVQVMDTLIDRYGDAVRGLVHSVTYENAEYIVKHSRHKKRMIIPQTEDVIGIKRLLDKRPKAIIITPSMTEGSDLSGDYCRFIFFFKVPFPYLGDRWVSRKKDINPDWYTRETINQVVQGCGRGVRSKDDYCITFVLDSNFNNLIYKKNLMPSWFKNAIITT